MTALRYLIQICALAITAVMLSACGSDSPSASSGGGSVTVIPGDPAALAGTYSGSATLTVSALGISESQTYPVTITIEPNGNVSIRSGSEAIDDVAVLRGSGFSYTTTDTATVGQYTCSGTITVSATIANGRINGNLSTQNANCNGIGLSLTGTLQATRQ